jgi:predicted RNase H-like HicB family nuclease
LLTGLISRTKPKPVFSIRTEFSVSTGATRFARLSAAAIYSCYDVQRVLEHDLETGDYSAVCPELPGCASAGETEEEARINIREAIELYLAPGDLELPENAKLVEVTVG